ncbi:HK97 gp10 family phage protein [Ignatzschineria rhizosphaerae]|uniref:HK97 gp10 family phage protein n=1 Tax=Ignatzschineria rhizosphaerae TaxID=2923279 RepID=A0ABY3WZB0_9GAMM|nr:HK97 gp10 family phage protein [Ignatzschineria rhizosphaerae]UNM95951.1 HK97 gp10 family phage protein [Ignatzschineria rhizosphaerae]
MGIKEQIEAAKNEILLEVEGDVRKAALLLKSKIEQKVPVDTGELKGSWSLIEETPYSFQVVSSAAHATIVEYGLFTTLVDEKTGRMRETPKTLDGYSKQAPKGFARIAIQEVINEFK